MLRIITVAFVTIFQSYVPLIVFILILYVQILCTNWITSWKILMKLYNRVFWPIFKKKWTYYSMALSVQPSIRLSVRIFINILIRAIILLPFRTSSCKVIGICIRSGRRVAYKNDCSPFLSFSPNILVHAITQ